MGVTSPAGLAAGRPVALSVHWGGRGEEKARDWLEEEEHLVAVAGEALLADALAGLFVAGGGEAALGDVVAGGQDAVTHLYSGLDPAFFFHLAHKTLKLVEVEALRAAISARVSDLVLEWFAEASALLGGGALLALGLVGGAPGTLQAGGEGGTVG